MAEALATTFQGLAVSQSLPSIIDFISSAQCNKDIGKCLEKARHLWPRVWQILKTTTNIKHRMHALSTICDILGYHEQIFYDVLESSNLKLIIKCIYSHDVSVREKRSMF